MIDNAKDLLKLPIDYDFKVDKQKVINEFMSWGWVGIRYYGLTASDVSKAYDILLSNKVSPAWFLGYTISEGGGAGGWINHYASDTGKGWQADLERDIDFVNSASGAYSTGGIQLAWDDRYGKNGGTIGKVPQNIKEEGDAYASTLPTPSIGRVMLAGTASVAWGFFYPELLLGVNNGQQNFANGAEITRKFLNAVGAIIDGSGGGSGNGVYKEPNKDGKVKVTGKRFFKVDERTFRSGDNYTFKKIRDNVWILFDGKERNNLPYPNEQPNGGNPPKTNTTPTTGKVDTEKLINWFVSHEGKITYWMGGSRNGSDGTGDCSGTMTQALFEAGAGQYAYLYSTDTIHDYLTDNGYKLISENKEWEAQRGDIIIWGKKGQSSGSLGHIMVMISPTQCISTNYSNGETPGAAVTVWNYDNVWGYNGRPYFYVYRQ